MKNKLLQIILFFVFVGYAQEPVIWSGEKITFSKLALGDADELTSNVTLVRGDAGGLYNSVSELGNSASSPEDTQWAYGKTQDDIIGLNFGSFRTSIGQGNQGNKPPVGVDLVLHLITDNIYIDIKFLTWETGGNYTYERSTKEPGIRLNGIMSAENNQIKNVANPTHAQDAVTLGLLLEKISNLQDQIDEQVYTIGHWPELGGYVFMVSDDGKHGLVAETEDQGFESWYNAQNLISNPLHHSANGQNFTDWRLPTRYELAQMYSQKSEIESAGGDSFGTKTYWTSNQSIYSINGFEEETAWRQNFGTGIQYSSNAIRLVDELFIRSVREF